MDMRVPYLVIFLFVAFGDGTLWNGVCKESINGECRCYKGVFNKEVDRGSLYFNKYRGSPVQCQQACDLYPCCNGETGRYCKREGVDPCTGITIVTRHQWKAQNPRGPIGNITKPVAMFYIHHTAGKECSDVVTCGEVLRGIQEYHFSLGWYDIGYSFLIGEDGRVYEGRGWNKVGAHTEGYNSVSYGASIMGNFMRKLPDAKALSATKLLIACGVHLGKIDQTYSLYGHRDAEGDTECPGDYLYKEIHGWKNYNRTANPSSECAARGRRCRRAATMCKTGSVIDDPSLCKGVYKVCCLKP